MKKFHQAVISVGANIDPHHNIERAKNILGSQLLDCSPLLITTPEGYTEQPDFINCAFLIQTTLTADALKQQLLSIESQLGRVRTANKNGPRTIDLDITVFDGEIVDDDFYKYNFVKKSILHLLPELNYKEEK